MQAFFSPNKQQSKNKQSEQKLKYLFPVANQLLYIQTHIPQK